MPKNRKWDSLGFFNIRSVAKHQKIEAGTVWGKTFFEKKSHNSKKLKRGSFSLSRYFMLRGKREKPFWFSSLGQMIQFGTITFCRTIKKYFGQFVWIETRALRKLRNRLFLRCEPRFFIGSQSYATQCSKKRKNASFG